MIARDHAVGALIKLAALREYSETCLPLVHRQLRTCPDNQFPMCAEVSLGTITEASKRFSLGYSRKG